MEIIRKLWYSPVPYHSDKMWISKGYKVNDWDDFNFLYKGSFQEMSLVKKINIYVFHENLHLVDYIYTNYSWPIFSTRVVDTIESFCADNIQKYPAPLYDYKTKKRIDNHDYWVLNIIHRIECIDWGKSIWNSEEDKKKGERDRTKLKIVVFKNETIPSNVHILRLDEFPTNYFFSQAIYDQFIGMNLKGIAFFQHGEGAKIEINPSFIP